MVLVFIFHKKGSITVFLTFVFLLIFSLVGITYDCSRISAARGYIKTAGASAAQTVFGDYNRELFMEYGLFGYGGYDGRGAEDLNSEFYQILQENIQTYYGKNTSFGSNIYRMKNMDSLISDNHFLTEKEVFYDQIHGFLKRRGVKKMTDAVLGKAHAAAQADTLDQKLSLAEKYESGDYESLKEEKDNKSNYSAEENASSDTAAKKEEKDSAGGNPLKTFSHLVRDGVLGMVCDEKALSDKTIIPREEEVSRDNKIKQTGAADYLKQFLQNDNLSGNVNHVSKGKNKMLLLAYDREVCSNYLTEEKEGICYAMEYLVAGKGEERDNIASVVNRLLAVRTILNFSYVAVDPALQEKSLATATALAGFTGMPPVISGVQYTILLILAFQEACVDVTALLDGKSVPVTKNAANFKMKYEEICVASKALFREKAAVYTKEKTGAGITVSYQEYLTMFLLLVGEDTLRIRTLDVIQQNLRDKYNQSFCIDDCICSSVYEVTYEIEIVFQKLPFLGSTFMEENFSNQCQEVSYGYRSG